MFGWFDVTMDQKEHNDVWCAVYEQMVENEKHLEHRVMANINYEHNVEKLWHIYELNIRIHQNMDKEHSRKIIWYEVRIRQNDLRDLTEAYKHIINHAKEHGFDYSEVRGAYERLVRSAFEAEFGRLLTWLWERTSLRTR